MLSIIKEKYPNLTDEQYFELQEITYLKRDFNTWNFLPCEIQTKDKVIHNQALIVFSDSEDLKNEYKEVISPEEILTIKPSEYALPYQISNRTFKSIEIDKDFFPTVIQSKKTKEFIVISSTAKFLDFQDVKGADIRQKKIEYSGKYENTPIYKEDKKSISILQMPHEFKDLF